MHRLNTILESCRVRALVPPPIKANSSLPKTNKLLAAYSTINHQSTSNKTRQTKKVNNLNSIALPSSWFIHRASRRSGKTNNSISLRWTEDIKKSHSICNKSNLVETRRRKFRQLWMTQEDSLTSSRPSRVSWCHLGRLDLTNSKTSRITICNKLLTSIQRTSKTLCHPVQ